MNPGLPSKIAMKSKRTEIAPNSAGQKFLRQLYFTVASSFHPYWNSLEKSTDPLHVSMQTSLLIK